MQIREGNSPGWEGHSADGERRLDSRTQWTLEPLGPHGIWKIVIQILPTGGQPGLADDTELQPEILCLILSLEICQFISYD